MKKALVVLMAISMLFAMGSMALAKQEANLDGNTPAKGNIVSNEYVPTGFAGADAPSSAGGKNYNYFEQGTIVAAPASGDNGNSTHVYGTWNSPYTNGVDGYNYNDAQDYVADGAMVKGSGTQLIQFPTYDALFNMTGMGSATVDNVLFQSGPHGGYLTSTHRCRECHAVHRAAGKFKLLRSDSRFEACDWCHGTGAGSGYNIQMDNDDQYTTEYNVGHTMGFGIDSGKWKAPDDTYPAFTPNYWQGGFSCFDCHSPHANPQRMMGFDAQGRAIPSIMQDLTPADGPATGLTGVSYNIGNPGHDDYTWGGEGFAKPGDFVPALGMPLPKSKPYYMAGSWLLIKNPDREMASQVSNNLAVTNPIQTFTGPGGFVNDPGTTLLTGQEIPDWVTTPLKEFDSTTSYPVNKTPISWDNPIGSASLLDENFSMLNPAFPPANEGYGDTVRNPFCRSLILDEFCTDCHDGNAGLHTQKAPLFSEDRALRGGNVGSGGDNSVLNDRANYDLAYGHDTSVRH